MKSQRTLDTFGRQVSNIATKLEKNSHGWINIVNKRGGDVQDLCEWGYDREDDEDNRKNTGNIKTVYNAFESIEMPIGNELFVPTWNNGEHRGEPVLHLGHRQAVYLGQLISKKIGIRYTLLPVQATYLLTNAPEVYRNTKHFFPSHYNEDNLHLFNREVILKLDNNITKTMPNPTIAMENGKMVYRGKTVPVKSCTNDLVDILIESGILQDPANGIGSGEKYIGRDNIAHIMSTIDKGRIDVWATDPFQWQGDTYAVYAKTDKHGNVLAEAVRIAQEREENRWRNFFEKN